MLVAPPNFSPAVALEILALVSQAYQQYQAFEAHENWTLPAPYTLVSSYTYQTRNLVDLPLERRRLHPLKRLVKALRKPRPVPIGFLAQGEGADYLIFRGTDNILEAIYDVRLRQVPLGTPPKIGMVHKGFLAVYEAFEKEIAQGLQKLEASRPLFISGHSLGGPLATFAALQARSLNASRPIDIYTFASPRVGNRDFVAAFEGAFAGHSWRINNEADIVPSMPLPISLELFHEAFYEHVDAPVTFSTQTNDVIENHRLPVYEAALKSV